MEGVVSTADEFWRGRSVFLTGHTGFKGGWLSVWLRELGATVHGYSLDPPSNPNLFDVARLEGLFASDIRADLLDAGRLVESVRTSGADVVFHLAAQALVRDSYREPMRTFMTNAIGTGAILDAVRQVSTVRAVVVITTDKVYENPESVYPFREIDPLGGRDPYSASKAAAELVTASYRASFFSNEAADGHRARIASARAGNVIGGGDWAVDRLVPDCVRAFQRNEPVRLRFPDAVRPWQHVLEPLSGYLDLARTLVSDGDRIAGAWNFGPAPDGDATVGDVATRIARLWGKGARVETAPRTDSLHEAGLLRLDPTRARTERGWRPRWTLSEALEQTIGWYRDWLSGADMLSVCREQIGAYARTTST